MSDSAEQRKPSKTQPVVRRNWDEFRDAGLMWWVNSLLQVFGWVFVVDTDTGEYYPARTLFRGFSPEINDKGYQKVTEYLRDNIPDLCFEAEVDQAPEQPEMYCNQCHKTNGTLGNTKRTRGKCAGCGLYTVVYPVSENNSK